MESLQRPSFRAERRLAEALSLPLLGLRRLGVREATAMSESELRGNAHGLSRAILSSLWQRRQRAPDWERVSRAWESRLDALGDHAVGALSGEFAPDDTVELLTDNAGAFALRSALYASAQRSLNVATYYVQDDDTGRRTVDELAAAARRGVRVRLVADAYIMEKKEYEGLGALRVADDLRRAGVDVRLWRDPARPYDANHRKMLVVDGEHLVVGGRNIADHYAGALWRDVELHLRGSSAAQADALFERTFAREPEPPTRPGALVVATTPADVHVHGNFLYLLACLRDACATVDLENAYPLEHPAVTRALAAATRRGVRVRVLTNSAESNDLDFANYGLYGSLLSLVALGASVHLRRGKGRTLHCKYFVVDGARVSVGTSNLDYYSPRFCTDVNVQARDTALAARLTAWFEAGLADATPVTDAAELEAVRASARVGRVFDALMRDTQ